MPTFKHSLVFCVFLLLAASVGATPSTQTLRAGTTQTVILQDAAGLPFAILQPFGDTSRGFRVLSLDGGRILGVWFPVMEAPVFWDYRKRAEDERAAKLTAAAKLTTAAAPKAEPPGLVSISKSGLIHEASCRYFDKASAVQAGGAATKNAVHCKVCAKKGE